MNSPELTDQLEADVAAFCDAVSSVPETVVSGRIALEFFQKRKRQWPLPEDVVPWEIWQLQVDVVRVESENGRFFFAVGLRVAWIIVGGEV